MATLSSERNMHGESTAEDLVKEEVVLASLRTAKAQIRPEQLRKAHPNKQNSIFYVKR